MKQARALISEQKFGDALGVLASAADSNPGDNALVGLFRNTIVLHLESKIKDGYTRIATNKHDIEAYLSTSNAFSMAGNPFSTLSILTLGTIENPESVKLWLSIGILELQRKRDAEAFSVFKEILKLDQNSAHAYNNIAFVRSRSDDTRLLNLPQALAYAKKAISLEPSNPNFIYTLAEIDFIRGEKEQAIRLLSRPSL